MFVLSECDNFPLTSTELNALWETTRVRMHAPDDDVAMACVSREEIQRLNREYRKKDAPTNILTFSYGSEGDHDVAICMDVAKQEATQRDINLREYVALLVVHGFLHVCNMDHEASGEEASLMQQAEREILVTCGFVPQALSDVY